MVHNQSSAGRQPLVTSDFRPHHFRFWIDQDVRFRDLDTLKHVNHTVYFIYAEMARLEYYRQILKLNLMTDLAFLMLDIRCHYRAAAEFGDRLRVGFRVDWLKRSSSGFSFLILDPNERVFAEGGGIQVYIDLGTRRPLPIPNALRETMLGYDTGVRDMR
jgi:acyl-CoA thioester hydrolase